MSIVAFGLPTLSTWYSTKVFPYILPLSFGFIHTFRDAATFATEKEAENTYI